MQWSVYSYTICVIAEYHAHVDRNTFVISGELGGSQYLKIKIEKPFVVHPHLNAPGLIKSNPNSHGYLSSKV
jgi:hypothetical protein